VEWTVPFLTEQVLLEKGAMMASMTCGYFVVYRRLVSANDRISRDVEVRMPEVQYLQGRWRYSGNYLRWGGLHGNGTFHTTLTGRCLTLPS
jgi:hypothetical protein